jgi:hypothetical protein
MPPKLTLGLKVRTGKAALIAIRGPATDPQVVVKGMIQVAHTFEEGAVFHAAQEMPLAKARAHVERAEARFAELARKELAAFVAKLGEDVTAAALAAPAPKDLPAFERIVKAHPLVHAAEIELYRRVFASACEALGVRATRVEATEARVASALGWTPARVRERLAAIGKAAGRPWAAEQKEASLAAWFALAMQ